MTTESWKEPLPGKDSSWSFISFIVNSLCLPLFLSSEFEHYQLILFPTLKKITHFWMSKWTEVFPCPGTRYFEKCRNIFSVSLLMLTGSRTNQLYHSSCLPRVLQLVMFPQHPLLLLFFFWQDRKGPRQGSRRLGFYSQLRNTERAGPEAAVGELPNSPGKAEAWGDVATDPRGYNWVLLQQELPVQASFLCISPSCIFL